MQFKSLISVSFTALLMASHAFAQNKCGINGTAEVNGIVNSFPVLDHIAKTMQNCASNGVTINVKVTDKARAETEQAFASSQSPFGFAQVSNGVLVNLQAAGQLEPMTDLVKKYKDKFKLEDKMLVTMNGEIYGIAFMANAQHMFYRKDILEKAGIAAPKTWAELLAAAEKLKKDGNATPFSAAFKSGWDIATEFTNIYLGTGGDFFQKGSAQPAFNNDNAVKSLELMKSLAGYMSPNHLALGTADVTTSFQQGQTAIGILWGSRATAMDDDKVSKVVNQIEFAASPAHNAGGKPSNAIWWDAFVMPKNFTGNREATFLAIMEGVSEETMKSGMGLTTWLRSGYQPTRAALGVHASITSNANFWPDQPYFSLLHGALGKAAPDFLSGKKTAKEALVDAEKEYLQSAKDKGFIK